MNQDYVTALPISNVFKNTFYCTICLQFENAYDKAAIFSPI